MKFLIDECLSPTLADMAVAAGYPESAHVAYRGMASWKDHRLMRAILADDWTFVTHNADDFRPKPGSLSQKPGYVGQLLHAGLVCLNFPEDSVRMDQKVYFQEALNRIKTLGDLVNQILEIDSDDTYPERLVSWVYEFPQGEGE